MDEEQEVMTAMKVAGFDSKQIRAMTYTSWKDGIDIDRPATSIMAFARLIRSGMLHGPEFERGKDVGRAIGWDAAKRDTSESLGLNGLSSSARDGERS